VSVSVLDFELLLQNDFCIALLFLNERKVFE